MKINNRIQWIDLTRVIAIFFVIFCHSLDKIYHIIDFNVISSLSLYSKLFIFSGYVIGRLAVPFFLMITGYLLLDRKYDILKTNIFWKKNCLHLLICTIIWCFIYDLFLIIFLNNDLNLLSVICDVFLLKPINISHLWYMPMIIGMYILIPFVANALKEYDVKTIFKPLIFFSLLIYIIPFLIKILNIYGINDISVQISLGFSGGMYGLYIIMGYLIKKDMLKNIESNKLLFLIIVSSIITVAFQFFAFSNNYQYYLWYDFPLMVIISVCLFELISRIKNINMQVYKIIYFFSKYSFSVFLIHIIFMDILLTFVKYLRINNSIKVFILCSIVLIISYISVFIISKIPVIGKYILYLKS